MTAYYNEFEPYAAEWLRNLIKKGLIADGIVDDRSITSVEASDLGDFTQCHFFAGIGVWSHALRLAGWPDDRPVWTGSCPCQPFSAAGKGKGVEDERHLWPEFHRLIAECRPPVVFGEQVASKDGLGWLDAVCADMEASGYAIGAADLCAAGIGAPHIRQRLWFVGERMEHAESDGRGERWPEPGGRGVVGGRGAGGLDDTAGARHVGQIAGPEGEARNEARLRVPGEGRGSRGLGHADSPRHEGHGLQPLLGSGEGRGPLGGASGSGSGSTGGLGNHHHEGLEGQRRGHQAEGGRLGAVRPVAEAGEPRGMADAEHDDRRSDEPGRGSQGRAADGRYGAVSGMAHHHHQDGRERSSAPRLHERRTREGGEEPTQGGADRALGHDADGRSEDGRPRPTNGHWRDADWLHCRDGKWRPVEPGTFPLAHGAPARVGRLRAYGNAIVPQVAAEVIRAFLEARP